MHLFLHFFCHLFRMFDTNHDNKVSFTEFIMGLAIHTKSNEGDRVRALADVLSFLLIALLAFLLSLLPH
jgi:hypothetical protein